jgi:hypothetical protein
MLVGGPGVTVKSNNNAIYNDENGTLDVNSIKLRIPGTAKTVKEKHHRGISINKPMEDEKNLSADELENHNEPDGEEQPKLLRGDKIKNILKNTFDSPPLPRMGEVVSTEFNEKRDKAIFRNYGQTFIIRNAHKDGINCICYLINGTFMTGSSDK